MNINQEQLIIFKTVIVNVGDVHHRLHREKEKGLDDFFFVVGELDGTGGLAFVSDGLTLFEHHRDL